MSGWQNILRFSWCKDSWINSSIMNRFIFTKPLTKSRIESTILESQNGLGTKQIYCAVYKNKLICPRPHFSLGGGLVRLLHRRLGPLLHWACLPFAELGPRPTVKGKRLAAPHINDVELKCCLTMSFRLNGMNTIQYSVLTSTQVLDLFCHDMSRVKKGGWGCWQNQFLRHLTSK